MNEIGNKEWIIRIINKFELFDFEINMIPEFWKLSICERSYQL